LSRCSANFDRCFQQQTQNASPYGKIGTGDITLELDDTRPDVFDAFMIWLYTGAIPHHLIEGIKEEPVKGEYVNGVKEAGADDEEKPEDEEGMTSWDINLNNDDTLVKDQHDSSSCIANEASSSNGFSEKTPDETTPQVPSPPTRSMAEKPEVPKETLCPCCARPYKWRGLEGFLERRFIALYVFATRYDIPSLRRAVIIAWQTND
jgi:hypothetical protein